MKLAKLCLSVCCLSFAGMVLGVHQTGRFFPWVHGFALVSVIAILGLATTRRARGSVALGILVAVAVAIRVFLYLWPASMIGMDPDKYATGVNRVMQMGDLGPVAAEVPTYAALPAFYTFNVSTSLIAGLEGDTVLLSMPIAMGAVLPLTAAALARRVGADWRITTISGLVASFIAAGVLFSYWPIAQVLAVLVWFPMLLLLAVVADTGSQKAVRGALICAAAAVFSHKISLLIPVLAVGLGVLLYELRDEIAAERVETLQRQHIARVSGFAGILAICLVVQWTFVTEFVGPVLLSKAIPLLTGGVSVVPLDQPATAAVLGNPGIPGILARRAHLLILLPTVSLAGAWLWIRRRDGSVSMTIAAAAIPVLLAVISLIGVQVVSPRRAILFGIPAFAVVLAVALEDVQTRIPVGARSVVPVVVLALLAVQVAGAPVAPDYPNESRQYLSPGEVSGKAFMMNHTDSPIAMDYFYAREQVDVASRDAAISGGARHPPGTIPLNGALLNATLTDDGYEVLLLRENADVIRFDRGGYRLLWDPIERTSEDQDYNRVYDNGHAVGFRANSS